jgi:hypothetical protein
MLDVKERQEEWMTCGKKQRQNGKIYKRKTKGREKKKIHLC